MTNKLIFKILKARLRIALTKQREVKHKEAILIIVFVYINIFILNDLIENAKKFNWRGEGSNVQEMVGVMPVVAQEITPIEPVPDNTPTLVEKIEKVVGNFSAYTADVAETDLSPTTMANGKKVFDGAIANNCLEFGTKVEVNNKIYLVSDRMNKRYDCSHFDIFFTSKEEAIKFGRRKLEYRIIK